MRLSDYTDSTNLFDSGCAADAIWEKHGSMPGKAQRQQKETTAMTSSLSLQEPNCYSMTLCLLPSFPPGLVKCKTQLQKRKLIKPLTPSWAKPRETAQDVSCTPFVLSVLAAWSLDRSYCKYRVDSQQPATGQNAGATGTTPLLHILGIKY